MITYSAACNSKSQAPITLSGVNLKMQHCLFVNNSGTVGAMILFYSIGEITNCTFT